MKQLIFLVPTAYRKVRKWNIMSWIICVVTLCSCGSTKVLSPLPPVSITYNYYEYTIQNMDNVGKCDNQTLTAHYDGFDVIYKLNQARQMIFIIENKSNKSLILDKSKCYVLYDGYSKELFKDVRTGRMTTYNNVQDAINNVQTNESSITLSIPPYSKWEIPISETNIVSAKFPDKFYWEIGEHSFTPYTTNATTEFVIPYTYDYALAKWSTSRNRLYIGNIHVEKKSENLQLGSWPLYGNYVIEGFSNGVFYHGEASQKDLDHYRSVVNHNNTISQNNEKVENRKTNWLLIGLGIGAFAITLGVLLLPSLLGI